MSKMVVNQSKERGMVAIMVTLILMIVISLIVLGFAQISRRNQRQTLDRQLSTQAFYAAETGLNDVTQLIKAAIASNTPVTTKTDCTPNSGAFYASLTPVISAADKVEYTCLMVTPDPTSLKYTVGTTGTVIPVITSSGTLTDITLTWQSTEDTPPPVANCPNTKTVLPASTPATWTCEYGVLRFDMVPTAGLLSSGGLNPMISFVVPLRPGSVGSDPSSWNFGPGSAFSLRGVLCSQSNCSITITGLTQSQYHLRVSSLYKDVGLTVTAHNNTGAVANLIGAQALVDVTGKAQDVLRRIQVRLPLTVSSTNLMSDFALQSTESICKRYSVMDGVFQNDANLAVPGVAGTTTNALCQ